MKTLQFRTIVFPGAQRTLHKISMAIVVSLMVVFHSTVGISIELPDGSLIFRYEDDIYMDFLLDPAHYSDGDAVYFEVKGGDGIGFWQNQSTGQGGKGVTVGRYFTVGEDIPIDAIIRLMPGSRGRPATGIPISAGGSGSGVFYQHPDTLHWQPLLIAGGGGLYSRGGHPQADSHKNADGLIMPSADHSLALSFYEDDDVGRLHCIGSEDCEVPDHVVLHFDYFNKQFHVRDQPEECINTTANNLTLGPCDDGSTLNDAATWTVSYCNKGDEYLTDSYDATCVAYERPDLLSYVPPSNGPI